MTMDEWLSDSEAWALIGATIEGAEYLPGSGLCSFLMQARGAELISSDQCWRMIDQLYQHRHQLAGAIDAPYFWPSDAVRPRVRACYRLAKILERERK